MKTQQALFCLGYPNNRSQACHLCFELQSWIFSVLSKVERDRDGKSEREPHTFYFNASFWSFGVAAMFEVSRKQLAFIQR